MEEVTTEKQYYACERCGRPTTNHNVYGTFAISICDHCCSIIDAYTRWENEQRETEYLTCPYCGYKDKDSWEAPDSDDDWECASCGKHFSYERSYKITYTSAKRRCDYPGELPSPIRPGR